jgi:hypothetical protein
VSARAAAAPRWRDARAALWITFVLCAVSTAPYLRAGLGPPAGRSFAGTFHWIDDFCNYVSYAQQAESGRLVFEDKLSTAPQRPALVNLEWWLVGRISALLGRRPFVAFRVLGALATLALVAAVFQWLRGLGVPASHRTAAAVLVCTAGGLGGALFELTDRPVQRCPDLAIGFHPFLSILAQPHWTAGTALLLWALWCTWRARTPGQHAAAVALGTLLGLVRPYDLVLLVAARGLAVLAGVRAARWPARLLPLAGLLPVVAYLGWLFRSGFGAFSSSAYGGIALPPLDLVWALGPPALCLLAGLPLRTAARRAAALHLAAWIAVAALFVLLRPLSFSLQFGVGMGAPLLLLAARALARFRPAVTMLAALLLGSSALVAYRIVWRPEPAWFPLAERRAAAVALREPCRAGGLVLAPADIGLFTIALTSCRAYLSHPASPGFALRQRETSAFYGQADPAARSAWLERRCITHLVLPGDAGEDAAAWVGAGAGFRRSGVVRGGFGALSLYERPRPASCP